jgi:hypothetical protein
MKTFVCSMPWTLDGIGEVVGGLDRLLLSSLPVAWG